MIDENIRREELAGDHGLTEVDPSLTPTPDPTPEPGRSVQAELERERRMLAEQASNADRAALLKAEDQIAELEADLAKFRRTSPDP